MVMFHHEIPYRMALERGAVQAQMLAELTARRRDARRTSTTRARSARSNPGSRRFRHLSSVMKL